MAETIFSFASLFWYGVAWLARLFDLSAVLFVLFWLRNLLFLFVGYRWARLLFPHSWRAWYAGTLFIATSPTMLMGNGQPSSALEQTSFSVFFCLAGVGIAPATPCTGLYALDGTGTVLQSDVCDI